MKVQYIEFPIYARKHVFWGYANPKKLYFETNQIKGTFAENRRGCFYYFKFRYLKT
jgi:hypothetical protein